MEWFNNLCKRVFYNEVDTDDEDYVESDTESYNSDDSYTKNHHTCKYVPSKESTKPVRIDRHNPIPRHH